MKVLLVDDNDICLKLLGMSLARSGLTININQASNGADAVKMYGQHRPDLVITDVSMPVMDGITAAGQMWDIEARNEQSGQVEGDDGDDEDDKGRDGDQRNGDDSNTVNDEFSPDGSLEMGTSNGTAYDGSGSGSGRGGGNGNGFTIKRHKMPRRRSKIYALTGLGSSDPRLKLVGTAGHAAIDGWLTKGKNDREAIMELVSDMHREIQAMPWVQVQAT